MYKVLRKGALWFLGIHLFLNAGIAFADAQTATQSVIAPSGTLLVGVYRGSPSSIIEGPTTEENRGVGHDLGKQFAADLGVPFRAVIFPNNAALLDALKKGAVDFSVTNATAARKKMMDFSPTIMDVEKSFLVGPDSDFKSLEDITRSEAVVGVSKGSSTAKTLHDLFPKLQIREIGTLKLASDMLQNYDIDAFATNNAILYQMSDAIPGSSVLPGHWGMEHFAAGIPKGRSQGLPALQKFVSDAQEDGRIAKAIERAGLRGTLAPGNQ